MFQRRFHDVVRTLNVSETLISNLGLSKFELVKIESLIPIPNYQLFFNKTLVFGTF